jgi:hypothetical protein
MRSATNTRVKRLSGSGKRRQEAIRQQRMTVCAERWSAGIAVILLLVACNGDPSMLETNGDGRPPLGVVSRTVKGVVVTADAQLDPNNPGWIVLSLNLRNETGNPVEIEWLRTPGCKFWRRAYRAESTGEEADWDAARSEEPRPCLDIGLRTIVPAGSDIVGPKVPAHVMEVLGDSLPEGDYHFTLTVAPLGEMAELFAGTIALTRGGG